MRQPLEGRKFHNDQGWGAAVRPAEATPASAGTPVPPHWAAGALIMGLPHLGDVIQVRKPARALLPHQRVNLFTEYVDRLPQSWKYRRWNSHFPVITGGPGLGGPVGYLVLVWKMGQPISVRQADSSGVSARPDR